MKRKFKVFLSLSLIVSCLFIFALISSAQEFYVSSVDELKSANADAIANEESDTIYITADIEGGSFVANSSVTYVLQANWTKCSTNKNAWTLADYVDIAFMADGENRTLSFSGNVFQTTSIKPVNSTLTFGGVNGGRLIVDMSSYTNYFMYNSCSYNIYLYDVTFKDYTYEKNDWILLSGKTINIYDGAKIEGCYNKNGALFAATTLNMYGGEICNNYTVNNMGRIFDLKYFNMSGGAIYNNYNRNTRSDNYTNNLIQVSDTARIFGGSIYSNYFTFTPNNTNCGLVGFHGTTANKGWCVPSVFGTNYGVDSSIKVEKIDGIFTLTSGTPTESNNYRLGNGAYSVMFKNSDGSLIEGYIFRDDGTLAKSLSGTTEATVPSGEWTDQNPSCVAVSPVLTAQGTFYRCAPHSPESDDFDCTTSLVCKKCSLVYVEAKEHNIVKSLTYANYFEKGVYLCECTNDGCSILDQRNDNYAPMFTLLGFSVTEANAGFSSICMVQGFLINNEAIAFYEQANGVSLDFGVVVAADKVVGSTPLELVDGIVTKTNEEKVFAHSLLINNKDAVEIIVTGFDPSNEKMLNSKIIFCIYVSDGKSIKYVNNGNTYTEAPSVSYNEILN